MRSRAVLQRIARVALALMLFAQTALAVAACIMPERSPAQAIASTQAMPCHHSEAEQRNANLCLADCLSFDQSPDTPQLPALAPDPAPVLLIALPELVRSRVALESPRLSVAADPPRRILFQSFLI